MRQFGGLGLGLTLSRSIVELLDGRLAAASADAESRPPSRSRRPRSPPPASTLPAPPYLPASDPGPAPNCRLRVRILLVDDNPDTLKFLSMLRAEGAHHLCSAPDMASALRLASAADLDLLISDIELPDGSGLELMRTIRSSRPVSGIALSGFGTLDDIKQSRAAGFVASSHQTGGLPPPRTGDPANPPRKCASR